jgi:hypothetical protein
MQSSGIPIWFFIGVLLTIYGALILGYGVSELITGHYANVQLVQYHAPIWWGAILLAVGLMYDVKFRPGRK